MGLVTLESILKDERSVLSMKKKIMFSLIGLLFLTACGNTSDTSEMESSAVNMNQKEVLYQGMVAEVLENGLLVSELNPVDREDAAGFSEVILLMEDTSAYSDLQVDDLVEVTLIENAPTTMSIPPQIPGNAIIKIEAVK